MEITRMTIMEKGLQNNLLQSALVANYIHSQGLISEEMIGYSMFQQWIQLIGELYSHALEINRQISKDPTEVNAHLKNDNIWDTFHKIYDEMIGYVNNSPLQKDSDLGWLIAVYASKNNQPHGREQVSHRELLRWKFEYFLAKEIIIQQNKSEKILEDERLDFKAIRNIKAKVRKRKRELCKEKDTIDKTNQITDESENPVCSTNEILYIYKGNIRCRQYKHQTIQAAAILHDKTDNEIELNVEYCAECKKFF